MHDTSSTCMLSYDVRTHLLALAVLQPVTGAAASASSAEPTSTQSHRANVGNSTAPTSKQAKGVAGIFASMQQGLAGLFAWTQAAVSADSSSDADDSCSEHAYVAGIW